MNRLLMPLLTLALAACASTPPATQQTAAAGTADNGTVCERDFRTGSMMPTTRCTTAAQREAARREVDTVNDSVRNQRAAPVGKSGS